MGDRKLDYNVFEGNESHFPAMARCAANNTDSLLPMLIERYESTWIFKNKAGGSDVVDKVRVRIAYPKPGQNAETSEMHGYIIWVHYDSTTEYNREWSKKEKTDPAKTWGMLISHQSVFLLSDSYKCQFCRMCM